MLQIRKRMLTFCQHSLCRYTADRVILCISHLLYELVCVCPPNPPLTHTHTLDNQSIFTSPWCIQVHLKQASSLKQATLRPKTGRMATLMKRLNRSLAEAKPRLKKQIKQNHRFLSDKVAKPFKEFILCMLPHWEGHQPMPHPTRPLSKIPAVTKC